MGRIGAEAREIEWRLEFEGQFAADRFVLFALACVFEEIGRVLVVRECLK